MPLSPALSPPTKRSPVVVADFCRDPSEGSTEMLLVAKDMLAKEKWLAAFSLDLNRPPKDYERLICEGYLVKVSTCV